MKIRWYGHACFGIESSDGTIVLDPFNEGNVPGLKLGDISADVVLCSHGHNDHNAAHLIKVSGKDNSFKVNSVSCFHDKSEGADRGQNEIRVIETEGMKIVHLGDLGHTLTDDLVEKIGKVDVLLVPVGGFYTIDANEALETANKLEASIVVPMHFRDDNAGFGFDVIGTVEQFTSLCECVVNIDASYFDPSDIEKGTVVVLKPEAIENN